MGYETKVVHPAVAQWLTDNGYAYEHEVVITDAGRADFVATAPNGDTLIIECKTDCNSPMRTIIQVQGYCAAYGLPAKPAIAVPSSAVTDAFRLKVTAKGVMLITVDVQVEGKLKDDSETKLLINAAKYMRVCLTNPDVIIAEILDDDKDVLHSLLRARAYAESYIDAPPFAQLVIMAMGIVDVPAQVQIAKEKYTLAATAYIAETGDI